MKYDVAVFGGGPAGMMAAGRSAERGSKVVLIDAKKKLGTKLLMTGKGRCNITNFEKDKKALIEKFGKQGAFLYPAFNKFGMQETLDFFRYKGLQTRVERGNRVFPKSDRSSDVLRILLNYLKKVNVEIKLDSKVKELKKDDNIFKIKLSKETVEADKVILCTGGKSYPKTGSTGVGYEFAKKMGHTIVDPKPALCALELTGDWMEDAEGVSLRNVNINVYQNNKKKDGRFGEAIFTNTGISGPVILDMSKSIGELLKNGKVFLEIDFKPALNYDVFEKRIMSDFEKYHNNDFKNSLNDLLPKRMIPVIVKLSEIDPDKKVNSITKEERKRLIHMLKGLRVEVKALTGFENAVVTSGGIALGEIDPKTMQSKVVDNLYFAGEVIDLDGPTGGYNLQMCWSTGYLAGNN